MRKQFDLYMNISKRDKTTCFKMQKVSDFVNNAVIV